MGKVWRSQESDRFSDWSTVFLKGRVQSSNLAKLIVWKRIGNLGQSLDHLLPGCKTPLNTHPYYLLLTITDLGKST
jgi:hypothetical protein